MRGAVGGVFGVRVGDVIVCLIAVVRLTGGIGDVGVSGLTVCFCYCCVCVVDAAVLPERQTTPTSAITAAGAPISRFDA